MKNALKILLSISIIATMVCCNNEEYLEIDDGISFSYSDSNQINTRGGDPISWDKYLSDISGNGWIKESCAMIRYDGTIDNEEVVDGGKYLRLVFQDLELIEECYDPNPSGRKFLKDTFEFSESSLFRHNSNTHQKKDSDPSVIFLKVTSNSLIFAELAGYGYLPGSPSSNTPIYFYCKFKKMTPMELDDFLSVSGDI